jgi:hypothetical protein
MLRAPLWVSVLLVLVIIGLGVYAYFTTPLPFGLSSVIRTPGGANVAPAPSSGPQGARTAAGQTLVLGSTSVVVEAVQRNQDLASGGRGGPAGSFTVVQISIQNDGGTSLVPQASDFVLLDEQGRTYSLDQEATRSVNTAAKHRAAFDATVPPGSRTTTLLAFEMAPDATAASLRVTLGSGDVELPR